MDSRLTRNASASSLLADDAAFREEFEDSASAVLMANDRHSDERVAHVCSVARVFLCELYHLKMKEGEKKKKKKKGASASILSSSLSDSSTCRLLNTMEVSLRLSEWLGDVIPNGIVCHEIPSAFLSRIIENENLPEKEAIGEILTKVISKKLYQSENAGGTSELSEAVSLEILSDLMIGCDLLQSEMEIEYSSGSRKTDYLISAGGGRVPVGVSVTRAMEYQATFDEKVIIHSPSRLSALPHTHLHITDALTSPPQEAITLLNKKLAGICESTRGQASAAWDRQILHVLASDGVRGLSYFVFLLFSICILHL